MIDQLKPNMQQGIDAYKQELSSLRTGRAHPGLLSKVVVDYYGNMTALSQMANVTVSDSRTLMITPWDKQASDIIVKAIQISDLGLTPALIGSAIRVSIPMLTEDRRKDLVKHLKAESEKAKVSVRNIRRNAMAEIKEGVKEKLISEDEERKFAQDIQKITDQMTATIDQLTQDKEKELMTV
jgi:ribosome recycling factor